MGGREMVRIEVGINYPYFNYGWDFGDTSPPPPPPPLGWGSRAAWKQKFTSDRIRFQSLGIKVVRWFILGDGLLYGTGSDVPTQHPTILTDWRFNPPPLPQAIIPSARQLVRDPGDTTQDK